MTLKLLVQMTWEDDEVLKEQLEHEKDEAVTVPVIDELEAYIRETIFGNMDYDDIRMAMVSITKVT